MASNVGVHNSVRVIISRLEFECNVGVSRSDFYNAKVTRRGGKIIESITLNLSRSDFSVSSTLSKPLFEIKESQKECTEPQTEPTERYHFRSRKRALENAVCPQSKKSRAVVRTDTKVPKLVIASKNVLTEGVVVLAKMRTYAAWPAIIKQFRKTCVNVEFFGEGTTGNIRYTDIGLFEDNHQLITFNLKKKINGYCKSVQCAEGALNIPTHLSVSNIV